MNPLKNGPSFNKGEGLDAKEKTIVGPELKKQMNEAMKSMLDEIKSESGKFKYKINGYEIVGNPGGSYDGEIAFIKNGKKLLFRYAKQGRNLGMFFGSNKEDTGRLIAEYSMSGVGNHVSLLLKKLKQMTAIFKKRNKEVENF